MFKKLRFALCTMIAMLCSAVAFAQNTVISGKVSDSTGQAISSASVMIKGATAGTYTDGSGNFRLSTVQKPPFTLVISSVGYGTKEVAVNNAGDVVNVSLSVSYEMGNEIVVSASRSPERILESPVTIERIGAPAIRNAAAANYYDMLANLKGVDLTTSSSTFKTPSTRGFNGSGNLRFNQFVDGMDNQAPGLNFSVGNILGPTELDVENMELLPGASSALYGSGGQNGTLLITSKDPFKYQGFSAQIKHGLNHVDDYQRGQSGYVDWSMRYATKITEKLAFRISGQYVDGQDWQAQDYRNLARNNVYSSIKAGDRLTDPNYDGVNVFGDEASASMQAFAQAVRAQVMQQLGANAGLYNTTLNTMIGAGMTPAQIATTLGGTPFAGTVQYLPFLIPTHTSTSSTAYRNTFTGANGGGFVSRTGYNEEDLVDYNAFNVKLNGGLHYKINNNLEASLTAYWATGTTVYTGSDRYSIKNLKMGQYKAELKGKNFFIRGYTTQENSGDSYTATTAAVAINSSWKSNATWFQQYSGVYGAARLGLLPGTGGAMLPDATAHNTARGVAEAGRILPGSQAFKDAFAQAVSTPISQGGAKFNDKTDLYHGEAQYNFSEHIKVVDLIAGVSYRRFVLNSSGTIFADTAGTIGINEYGGYLQVQKKFLEDKLKLTAAGRFDKNENFEGRFTPRLSAVYEVVKDNNIRVSYQQGYRFPSTQDQYINLQTPSARLIGGLPEFFTFFNFQNNPAYTAESIAQYRTTFNPADLKVASYTGLKPERVESIEVGYKGLAVNKKLYFDVYAYYSKYQDFIGRVAVGRGASGNPLGAAAELASPFTTTNYSFVTNTTTPVKAFGFGAGVDYRVYKTYTLSANFYSDELRDVPTGFISQFNTPKYRYNVAISNPDVYKGFGFNAVYRWQDKVMWEGTFGTGEIPKYGYVDAMISYRIPNSKHMIKTGASNLFNKYYRSAFGNPQVGGLYYVSFGFNVF